MALNLDVSELTQAAAMKPTAHDNCIVLDLGAGAFPRDIEVRLPDDDGARQNALWDGSLNLAANDEVLCFEYSGISAWRVMAMGGNDGGAGKARVSEVWESDFGDVALQSDASGNLTINGTRTLTIPTDLIHAGDADTKLSFADDKISLTAGDLLMFEAVEIAGQDTLDLGDVAGGGDVDINFNSGQMVLRGSDNFIGVGGPTSPTVASWRLEVAGAGKRIAVASYSTTSDFTAMPALVMQKSHDNTIGTLIETISGERLGDLLIQGVDSNDAARSTAGFRVTQAAAASAGNVPAHMDLIAANNTVVMRLDSNRDVIIANSATPAALGQLHIDQSSGTAAQPVLYLDQADISEEMIQFETTIGVGNAIEAVGAKALTVTHFIKVTLPGSLTRYIEVGTIA